MSDVLDWLRAIGSLIGGLLGLSLYALQLLLIYRVFRWWAYERPGIARGGMPSGRVLVRRLWCRHRHVARGRDQYGKHSTFCISCNVDVNAGRPFEEWR